MSVISGTAYWASIQSPNTKCSQELWIKLLSDLPNDLQHPLLDH